jgi:hypothetical protein
MPKIKKDTTKYLKSCNSLKIFKYEKSKKYYACFYVGINSSSSGNKILSLKTENVNNAAKIAKEKFHDWFQKHKDDVKSKNFTNDIANPYFKYRIRKYKDNGKKENQGKREKQKYFNYMIKYFEKIDYKNNEQLTTAIEDMVENLRMDNKTDNTISKFTTVLSNMFNYAIKNTIMKIKPDFPMLKIVNNARPSYFNNELNLISKRLTAEYEKTEDKFYLETKDYINLIRSAGFRPGLEPLRIKKFQYRFIKDKKTKEQILVFTLFNTKTKPKHQLTCHPYFTKYIFPEIVNRNPNTNADTYLLFPTYENRQKVYNRIVKIFTRLSKELNLYYRNGSTRPIYSIRHTYIKNRYAENPQSLEVIARQSNTSPKMIHKNYLDEDDIMMVEEYRKMYSNKSSKN